MKHFFARMEEDAERFTRQTVTGALAQDDSLGKTVTKVNIIKWQHIARESSNVKKQNSLVKSNPMHRLST